MERFCGYSGVNCDQSAMTNARLSLGNDPLGSYVVD